MLQRPGKTICVGLNYHDHCREQGVDELPRADHHAAAAGIAELLPGSSASG